MADFLPFSQSRLSNQFLMLDFLSHHYQKGRSVAIYSYFLLAVLDLGIRLRVGHERGICIVDAFIMLFVKVTTLSEYYITYIL